MIKSALSLFVIVVGVLAVQSYLDNIALQNFASPKKDVLDSFEQKAIDINIETVRNLTNIATLIFGAVGAFWFTKYSAAPIPPKIWRFGIAAAVLAALSIYFGFIFERNMITMLSHRLVALQTTWIVWPLYAQILTFLISLFALGVIVFEGNK